MVTSPLFLPGWQEFNRQTWGAEPIRLRFEKNPANPPSLECVLYLDRRGRLWLPPLNYYLPVAFTPTPTQSVPSRHRQWLELAEQLATAMGGYGITNHVALPPEVADMRIWQWAGFRVSARYTFYIELPYDEALLDAATRKNVRKAARSGFVSERVTAMADVLACLEDSEERQGFSHRLTRADLELARRLLGDEQLRAYVCYAPNGEPAAAKVVLHQRGGRAIIWLSGSRQAYLSACATQLQFNAILADLHAAGAAGIDYAGANLPSVALHKSKWGGQLVPFFTLETPGLWGLARYMRDYWVFRRQRAQCMGA